MTNEQFDWILNQRMEKMGKVLGSKAKEYAGDDDRLHNFKRAAAMQGCTPEQALWGMMVKHIISVQDMVQSGEPQDAAMVDEKIGDLINYAVLLEALWKEAK